MADTMRGVNTNITKIRRDVFREVAKIMYSLADYPDKDPARLDKLFDELPFEIPDGW